MERRTTKEFAAVIAGLSIISTAATAIAKETAGSSTSKSCSGMQIAESKPGSGKGSDSACGKGSCGTDKKGAAAAAKKHGGKKHKTTTTTTTTTTEKPKESK